MPKKDINGGTAETNIRLRVLLLMLVAAVLVSSGCRFLPFTENSRPVYTLPETSEKITSATENSENTSAKTSAPESSRDESSSEATSGAVTPQESTAAAAPTTSARRALDDGFDDLARQLIISGLEKMHREITLDPLFAEYRVRAEQAEKAIDRIYAAYRDVNVSSPEYFYLSGAVKLNYYLAAGTKAFIEKATLLPQYWPDMETLDDQELEATRLQIEQMSAALAVQIKQQTTVAWQQLLLLHDWLIKEIVYATGGSQDLNNAAGAFLERTTLCQGYAQAFQLTARNLGFEVLLITGESEGIGHAWNLVLLDGQWYHVDVTHDDPVPDAGKESPVQHVHFLRSDAVMAQSHIWEKGQYPEAGGDGAHYYRQHDLTAANREELQTRLEQSLQTANLRSGEEHLFEWLYSGSDMPDREELAAMLTAALEKSGIYLQVYYRINTGKSVILLEISLSAD